MAENLQPTFDSAFGVGWDVMKKNFWKLILVILVSSLIGAVPSIIFPENSGNSYSFRFLFWLTISGPISYGIIWLFLKTVRNENPDIKDMFAAFNTNYWNVLVANLLTSVVVILGFVLLIIPGIYLACKLAFVPYLIMDKQMTLSEAFSTSWDMTKGYGWTIFAMGLVSILIGIAGILLLIVGIFPALSWIYASFSALYYAIDSHRVKTIEV